MEKTRLRRILTAAALFFSMALAGCSLQIPTDPDGTLERVRDGVLRVGVSPNPPWTELDSEGQPTGVEPDLVRGFADRIDAEIDWEIGAESELVPRLQDNELDLVIGGLDGTTPWFGMIGLTRSYLTSVDVEGQQTDHVMAIMNGENAFLFELEDYLVHAEISVPDSVQVER